jgi:transcription initiation factor TFIID TATA-box-binding protein
MYKLSISNIVCNGNAGYIDDLDLTKLAHCLHMKYDPIVFPAAVSKSKYPRTSNSIFRSSEFVIAEGKTPEECLLSAYCYVYTIRRLCLERTNVYNFTIHNIVCYTRMPRALNLARFERDHKTRCSWQPKVFVGLLWMVKKEAKKKVVFILFNESGNIVVAGLRCMEAIPEAEQYLYEIAKYMVPEDGETEQHQLEEKEQRNDVFIEQATNYVSNIIQTATAKKRPAAAIIASKREKKCKLQTIRL